MRRPHWIIVGLLFLYAVLAWTSISNKSLTYDESLHIGSALAQKQLGDYRIDPEDPALFKHWMALGLPDYALPTDTPYWEATAVEPSSQWAWSSLTVFGQRGTDPEALIASSRGHMLVLAVVLGALIAFWACQLGGDWAGVLAVAFFAFDPNFLAHGPIAKNDVIVSLGFLTTVYALWRLGRRITVPWLVALLLATAATLCVKFSGLLLAAIVPLTLAVRAMLPSAWTWWRGELQTRIQRLAAAVGLSVLCAAVCVLGIWASYGFRYAPSPDASYHFDLARRTVHQPLLVQADRLHLLPAAYLYGLAYTLDSANARGAFLLGEISTTGFWYYFPVAMAVKTPLAILAATVTALVLALINRGRRGLRRQGWAAVCLSIPVVLYLLVALRSNLNIGLRHVLPVYPLVYIAIAVTLRRYRWATMSVVLVLAVESLSVYPNYIPYFNVAAGGSRGGIRVLCDSNLDWGQDLKALAAWQQDHPDKLLYLSYFGTADPSAYGIKYVNCGAGYIFQLDKYMPGKPGVIAVSATHLQGMYIPPDLQWFYRALRTQQPIDVLGGTIYLYEWK